ncbi:MAG: multicopper oxidase domain-containing protein [Gemmatimonadaceae bacterium]
MLSYHRGAVVLSAGVLMSLGALPNRAANPATASRKALPVIEANDNRKPAGILKNDTLRINLVVQMARWYPEASDGPFVDVASLAEEGHAPTVPGPMIRVPTGTTIIATVRNSLTDSTALVGGMMTRPSPEDSTAIKPGESHTFTFVAGKPGTYLYSVEPGHTDWNTHEREQMTSALIVDPVNGSTDDRVFVINIYGDPIDSTHYRNAVAINGKGWPHTERISANVGDSLRWRVINGSVRGHPMHLHGFYFKMLSQGTPFRDTAFAADRQRMSVTEDMDAFTTMSMVFSPNRPGNWLFHCHLVFHVNHEARLDDTGGEHMHEADPNKHMAGLVLGLIVNPSPRAVATDSKAKIAKFRLFADEKARKGRSPLSMSYVLQRGDTPPAPDSVEKAGGVLVFHRNVPTEVTIINRAHQGTAVHWHGIELESFSDGVAGWSGMAKKVAPMIAPQDSFVAHLTLPRAGTFIYHTHLNDIEQLTSGMYGAAVVLEPKEKYDRSTDHAFVLGWDGDTGKKFVVNGDTLPPPLEIKRGTTHRFRFVNIAPADRFTFAVRQDTTAVTWTPRAKDGYDLPIGNRKEGPARRRLNVGETFDAEFTSKSPGEYQITVGSKKPYVWTQRLVVR